MERFVKGDVVVISKFPFSDLSWFKKRPALVVANTIGDDVIICAISSRIRLNEFSLDLTEKDFLNGKLNVPSLIRLDTIFSAKKTLIEYKIGSLKKTKIKQVENSLIKIFKKEKKGN